MPITSALADEVMLHARRHGRLEWLRLLTPAHFVPLVGEHGQEA